MKIIDKKIAPYEIHADGNGNYTVTVPMPNKNKLGETVYSDKGHYSSVGNGLKKIARLLVEKKVVFTVGDYIKALKKVEDNILNLGR